MMHNSKSPIGIFDSGIGGLTVANAIVKKLPMEDIIYFGDTAHLPYGDKSAESIRGYSLAIADFLYNKGSKLIVVACNTASSAAFDALHDRLDKRVLLIDVVEPLVEKVTSLGLKKVGVIATKATIASGMYERKLHEKQPDLEVISMATPLLVPMIEEGFIHNNISRDVIDSYLGRPEFDGIEALLLACTHYPLIRKEIESFFDHKVQIFDSTDIVADSVAKLLSERNLLNTERGTLHEFYISEYTPSFEATTKLFYQEEIKFQEKGFLNGQLTV